jgi:hypothetical protein
MNNKSFITGSHAYGIPTEDSDIDIAVCLTRDEIVKLWQMSDSKSKLMFGKINLVCFNFDDEEDMQRFEKWKTTNDSLVAKRPVTKEEAIQAFRESGAEYNYKRVELSGPTIADAMKTDLRALSENE